MHVSRALHHSGLRAFRNRGACDRNRYGSAGGNTRSGSGDNSDSITGTAAATTDADSNAATTATTAANADSSAATAGTTADTDSSAAATVSTIADVDSSAGGTAPTAADTDSGAAATAPTTADTDSSARPDTTVCQSLAGHRFKFSRRWSVERAQFQISRRSGTARFHGKG